MTSYLFDHAPDPSGPQRDATQPGDSRIPPRQVRRIRRLAITVSVLALLLYTVFAATAPLPPLAVDVTDDAQRTAVADSSTIASAFANEALPTAGTWAEIDEVWASDEDPHPIASLTKLVTVLVAQEAAPVEPGENGDTYTFTALDDEFTFEVWAENGVAYPFPAGVEVTAREMLEMILLTSSNDTTLSYVNWVFGSQEVFLAAVRDWTARNGLDSVAIFDATGLDARNEASAPDLARIGKLALADPVLAEIMALQSTEVPYHGVIESTNPIIDQENVRGLKTGTTTVAGFNLAAARAHEVGDRAATAIAVTLGRADADARILDTLNALDAVSASIADVEVVGDAEVVGEVITWDDRTVTVSAAEPVALTLLPSEEARRSVELSSLGVSEAGAAVGSIVVESPADPVEVSIVLDAAIEAPGFWWRFTHPGTLVRGLFS